MRKKIVAGNWKMNKTFDEAQALVSEVVNMVQDEVNNNAEVVLCPPFPFLSSVGKALGGSGKIHLGAQNCHQKESGAYTGEVSADMLKSIAVEYVILGHSERRQYFYEDNQMLEAKVKAALKANHLLVVERDGLVAAGIYDHRSTFRRPIRPPQA